MLEPKILSHPDREEIVKQLIDGISPNAISKWLKEKYPEDKELQINTTTINDFRHNYLNLNREAVRMIKQEQKRQVFDPEKEVKDLIEKAGSSEEEITNLRIRATLLQSQTYKEKLQQITDAHLDAPRLMKELHILVQARLETYYDAISASPDIGSAIKADKMFLEYVAQANTMLKDSKKIWDDYNNQPDEGAVNLNVVHEQIGCIRDAVKDLLTEFSPDIALEFMDKLNTKLSNMRYKMPDQPDMLEEVNKLGKKVKRIKGDNE